MGCSGKEEGLFFVERMVVVVRECCELGMVLLCNSDIVGVFDGVWVVR